MEENMQHFWHVILYYFKKGKNTTEMQKNKKICAVFGEGAGTHQTCQKWLSKFHTGDFSLLHGQIDQLKLIGSNQDTN